MEGDVQCAGQVLGLYLDAETVEYVYSYASMRWIQSEVARKIDNLQAIPVETCDSQGSVGGGHGSITFTGDGYIYKRHEKIKTLRSAERWYRRIRNTSLASWTPRYFGTEIRSPSKEPTSLKMEDVTWGFDEASTSIMDIKLGKRSYAEDVGTDVGNDRYVKKLKKLFGVYRETCSKKEYMQFRDVVSTSLAMGFRVTAMRISKRASAKRWSPVKLSAPVCSSRAGVSWYNAQSRHQAVVSTLKFFADDGMESRPSVLFEYSRILRHFLSDLETSPLFRENEIIGSSVLLIHDKTGRVRVKWIDFSHVYEPALPMHSPKKKDGIIGGLKALIKCIEKAAKS